MRQLIDEAQHIIVCCHQNPDGDAIGACLAWAEYLRQQGKEPMIAVPDMFPDFLHWLPGTEKIVRYDKHADRVNEALTVPIWYSVLTLTVRSVWRRWER